jgi:N-ethylmaleimide reductase
MTTLFDPAQAGDLQLKNRVVMAPLTRNRAPGNVPNALMARYYAQRASAGLLITEATPVSAQGQGYADVPGLYTDAQAAGWRGVTDAVHAQGGHIVVQLWHVGRISHVSLQPGGAAPVAPSAIAANAKTFIIEDGAGRFVPVSTPRALELAELPGIVDDYRRAARTARGAAGFDGVEVHGANGYLLEQFLQSRTNLRTDAYGGSIANRARLLLEVTAAAASVCGAGRVGVRLSPFGVANGSGEDDPEPLYRHVIRALDALGLAYLHLIEPRASGAGQAEVDRQGVPSAAAMFRPDWRGVLIAAGNFRGDSAGAMVEAGHADAVAFGRLFISNPDLPARLRAGSPLAPYDRATFYTQGEAGYVDYPAWAGTS